MPGGSPGFFVSAMSLRNGIVVDAPLDRANFDANSLDYHFPTGREGRATARTRVVTTQQSTAAAPILPEDRGLFFFPHEDVVMSSVAVAERNLSGPSVSERTGRGSLRVALAGCGAVGSALIRTLGDRSESLARRHGAQITLTSVLVRDLTRSRDAEFDHGLLTDDLEAFLATDTDVVIEAIGGIHPSLRIAEETLRRGRTLVTANKALLAVHGTALAALAREHNATLRYDAAVGGGVPILRLLDDALGAGVPSRVRGILNGTTNFVLTRLERGDTVDQALHSARVAGFAEADASRDLDGRDAADKLALVAWAAFGAAPESVVVRRQSLLPDPARYTQLAARFGRLARQVAECAIVNDTLIASVEPILVGPNSAFARTRDEGNRVEVHTGWSEPLCASGPGAGGLPTATALVSDLVSTGEAPHRSCKLTPVERDLRTSCWGIEIIGAPSLLHRFATGCSQVHTDATASRAWTVVRASTPGDVTLIVDALVRAGADPVVARIDDADDECGGVQA